MGTDYSVEVECQYCHALVEFDPTSEDGKEFDYQKESHKLWLQKKYGSTTIDILDEIEISCYHVHECEKCGKIVAVSSIY